jgi:hypothetical protein
MHRSISVPTSRPERGDNGGHRGREPEANGGEGSLLAAANSRYERAFALRNLNAREGPPQGGFRPLPLEREEERLEREVDRLRVQRARRASLTFQGIKESLAVDDRPERSRSFIPSPLRKLFRSSSTPRRSNPPADNGPSRPIPERPAYLDRPVLQQRCRCGRDLSDEHQCYFNTGSGTDNKYVRAGPHQARPLARSNALRERSGSGSSLRERRGDSRDRQAVAAVVAGPSRYDELPACLRIGNPRNAPAPARMVVRPADEVPRRAPQSIARALARDSLELVDPAMRRRNPQEHRDVQPRPLELCAGPDSIHQGRPLLRRANTVSDAAGHRSRARRQRIAQALPPLASGPFPEDTYVSRLRAATGYHDMGDYSVPPVSPVDAVAPRWDGPVSPISPEFPQASGSNELSAIPEAGQVSVMRRR